MSLNTRYIRNDQVICYDMFWKVVDSFKRLQVILYEIDAFFLELNENNFHLWFSLNLCIYISCQIVTETMDWKSIVTFWSNWRNNENMKKSENCFKIAQSFKSSSLFTRACYLPDKSFHLKSIHNIENQTMQVMF